MNGVESPERMRNPTLAIFPFYNTRQQPAVGWGLVSRVLSTAKAEPTRPWRPSTSAAVTQQHAPRWLAGVEMVIIAAHPVANSFTRG